MVWSVKSLLSILVSSLSFRCGGKARGEFLNWAIADLQSFTEYLRLAVVFVRGGVLRERFNFCFSRAFCWYWLSCHFFGGSRCGAIILWGLGIFLIFPNFLRSCRSATCEATRIYHVYK